MAHAGILVARPEAEGRSHRVAADILRLAHTAAPIAGVGLVNLGISITDAAMMAQLDPEALAAGAVVGDVFSIVSQFAAGALSAFTAAAAGAHAAGNAAAIGRIIGSGVRSALKMGAAGALIVALTPDLLSWAGIELPLADAARTYAWYMAATFVLMPVIALVRNVFPAVGCGSVPLYVLLAAVPLNAVADGALMYGWIGLPRMGLAGAGAASLAVTVFMVALLVLYSFAAPAIRRCGIWRNIAAPARAPLSAGGRAMLMIGITAIFETGIYLSSTVAVAFCDLQAVPAHVTVFRLLALTYAVGTGFGQAVTIHAARRPDRAESLVAAAAVGTLLLGVAFMCFLVFAPQVAAPGMGVPAAKTALLAPVAGLAACALLPSLVVRGFLKARCDVTAPAFIGLAGYWGVGFAAMWILAGPVGMGALGIWIGLAAGSASTAVALCIYCAMRRPACPIEVPVTA